MTAIETDELEEFSQQLQAEVDRIVANGYRATRQDLMLLCMAERLLIAEQNIDQLHEDLREVIARKLRVDDVKRLTARFDGE